MDISGKEKFEQEQRSEGTTNYHSSNVPSDWRFAGSNISSMSMGMIPTGVPRAACRTDLVESSSCPSASMVDSFGPSIWDQSANSQDLGFSYFTAQNNVSTTNVPESRKSGLAPPRTPTDRALDMGWTPGNSFFKGSTFLPYVTGILPQNLSQFPADSGFIERAARFSCFSGGNFGDTTNPFVLPESMNPYSRHLAAMQGPHEAFAGSGLKLISGVQPQRTVINSDENLKDVNMVIEHVVTEGSPFKNERKNESFVWSHDEAKQVVGVSGNESDDAECSADGQEPSMMECAGGEPSTVGVGAKKRKRIGQDADLDQAKATPQLPADATKDDNEIKKKGDQRPSLNISKPGGKHGKQGSQASDSQKEEYIHVRARRGQATNSHSLAERVRREKISERMKFLQDLVPGCSKVTGKAVMLDEIINYVQSLQRQVEFLSMKLATVNPRLDFNTEGLLAKDILQSQVSTTSALGFPPDMKIPYNPLHPSLPGLIQAGLPSIGNTSDALRRSIASQLAAASGGYKEPTSQVGSVWEDELHNVVQMGLIANAPPNSQGRTASLPPGHMKVEL